MNITKHSKAAAIPYSTFTTTPYFDNVPHLCRYTLHAHSAATFTVTPCLLTVPPPLPLHLASTPRHPFTVTRCLHTVPHLYRYPCLHTVHHRYRYSLPPHCAANMTTALCLHTVALPLPCTVTPCLDTFPHLYCYTLPSYRGPPLPLHVASTPPQQLP